jgi:hypothetical protein
MAAWIQSLNVADVIAWLSAVSAAVFVIWRGWPIAKRVIFLLAKGVELVDTLGTLPVELAAIRHELEANSGKSVKDIAVRTEAAVAGLLVELEHVKRQGAALKTSAIRTNKKLDSLAGHPALQPQK